MPLLCPTAARALAAPVETSLRDLLIEYGLDVDQGVLVSLGQLAEHLNHFQMSCQPPIGLGELDEPRVLAHIAPSSVSLALEEISAGETAATEFKSTLLLNLARFRNDGGRPLVDYRSDDVLHSTLKTIAAFANTNGGTLYVGVEDDGALCGLSEDFYIANPKRADYDGWDQCLRSQIEARFVDGKAVNAYVQATALTVDDRSIVKVQVAPRRDLTFLTKIDGSVGLFIRSGTRSVPILYQDIQKHFELVRKF